MGSFLALPCNQLFKKHLHAHASFYLSIYLSLTYWTLINIHVTTRHFRGRKIFDILYFIKKKVKFCF